MDQRQRAFRIDVQVLWAFIVFGIIASIVAGFFIITSDQSGWEKLGMMVLLVLGELWLIATAFRDMATRAGQ